MLILFLSSLSCPSSFMVLLCHEMSKLLSLSQCGMPSFVLNCCEQLPEFSEEYSKL